MNLKFYFTCKKVGFFLFVEEIKRKVFRQPEMHRCKTCIYNNDGCKAGDPEELVNWSVERQELICDGWKKK